MALILADRVQELSTSPGGTGTINLAGAVTGFVSFATGVGTGNTTYYCIVDNLTGAWETGTGTYTTSTPNTLSRTTVYANSLGTTALISFTNGNTLNVFCTLPARQAGFRNLPINSQSAAYTLVLADAGQAILHPSTDANARTFTIPANGTVAYDLGTVLTFINMTTQVVSIAITTDTMYLAGVGTTGTRSLAIYGVATAVKMTSTTWLISGTGLT
jgi:hypothetical protein